jgi:glycosyltransferase involved in cell wall biosynthesis
MDDVIDWYAAADVMVLPSLSEGFPFAILEALALCCPVVATAVNGVPEIIVEGKTGLLVPPRDTRALEVAIRSLLRDPVWATHMAQRGQKEVLTRFTAGKMVQDTVRVFEEAMPTLRSSSGLARQAAQKEAA